MRRSYLRCIDTLAAGLALLFAFDRLIRLSAVTHFFSRPTPPKPTPWPTVSILQPITSSSNDLYTSLRARAQLAYAHPVQHLLVCDASDEASQTIVHRVLTEFPTLQAELILVETPGGKVASKISKLQAAFPKVTGDVLCFIDDDVAPRPDALSILIPYLSRPGVGAAFGLPYYTNWRTLWSSMTSGFANANMLLNFVPLTYLSNPFRVMGHFVAFRRDTFARVGGLDGLEHYLDDDYAIARRLREHGLRLVQTPLVYGTDNEMLTRQEYELQVKRWLVMPRQAMMSSLSLWERTVIGICASSFLLPSTLTILALLTRRRAAYYALATSLGLFGISHAISEERFLKYHTPKNRWGLLLLAVLLSPLIIIRAMLSGNVVEWRGQRFHVDDDGKYTLAQHATRSKTSSNPER